MSHVHRYLVQTRTPASTFGYVRTMKSDVGVKNGTSSTQVIDLYVKRVETPSGLHGITLELDMFTLNLVCEGNTQTLEILR
jgi:hypothetical protein